MVLDARQHVREIVEGIDAARFARRNKGIQAREAFARSDIADEEIVLTAQRNSTERALGRIVVEWYVRVVEEDAEFVPLTERVTNRDTERTLWWVSEALVTVRRQAS